MSASPIAVVRTVAHLRAQVAAWREAGLRVALTPTRGALHEGHLSLVRLARQHGDRVVASLFVNPTQFAPGEDFEAYPRDEGRDAALLAGAGCDLLYAPITAAMYPQGFATTVTVAGLSAPLEGEARPTHFAGVATVVTKLLIQAGADAAVFGEKDYQQLQVIRRLALDLDLPTEIVGAPIVRDADGLALSSRNAYLAPAERPVAVALNRTLRAAVERLRGGTPVADVEAEARTALTSAGFSRVDYVSVRHPQDLTPLGPGPLTGPARILAAAVVGRTRLIDNMAV